MGFFNIDEGDTRLTKPSRRGPNCPACRLHRLCKSPKLKVAGDGGKGILIIRAAPDATEDQYGTLGTGEGGEILSRTLKRLGIDMMKDCWYTTAIACRKMDDVDPTPSEIEHCRPLLLKTVGDLKPRLVLLLGGGALESYFGSRWDEGLGGIYKWRGWSIPDKEMGTWVAAVYDPIETKRENSSPVAAILWKEDIARAIATLKKKRPVEEDYESKIEVLTKRGAICDRLEDLQDLTIAAFDYETTGLKPHAPGHRILTCAIATGPNHAVAFPVESKAVKRALVKWLQSDVQKIGANIKYEETWSREILGTPVNAWKHDTMLAAHVLDNRPGIVSLTFQAFVHFGIYGYDREANKYKKSQKDERGANEHNRMAQMPLDKLLMYNGIDAMLEHRLGLHQMKELQNYAKND